jgi:alpha-1,3-rhamnosyl/mannosyltransferase
MTKRGLSLGVDARTLGATGIGRYVTELVAAMAPEHPETRFNLFVRRDSTDLFDQRLSALANISTFTTRATYYSLHEQLRYGRQLDAFGYDLIHFPNFNVPRYVRTPYVVTIHDLILLRFPGRVMWPGKRWLYKLVLNRTIRRASMIITDSDWSRRDILAYAEDIGVGDAADRVVAVPLGMSAGSDRPMTAAAIKRELTGLQISDPFFLCVGAQLKHKNIHRVVAAFASLIKRPDMADLRLVVAGRRTQPSPDLDDALRQHSDAAEQVIFTGVVSEEQLRALYRGALALVFVSEIEGFGLPILEAQAAGTPVITSNVTSMPEVAGGAAWLVKPTDRVAIGRAMRHVVEGKYPSKMIEAGRENARRFTWEAAAEATYQVYEKAIHQKK